MFKKKKKIAKGLDRTVLTGLCGPTPVLGVHEINKKSGSLGLKKTGFHPGSWFSRPDLPVRSDSKNHALGLLLFFFIIYFYLIDNTYDYTKLLLI